MAAFPDFENRLNAFTELGYFLARYLNGKSSGFIRTVKEIDPDRFDAAIQSASQANPWFTRENIKFALQYWADSLSEKKLRTWTAEYESLLKNSKPARVAVIMAGNIPLVGMHDFLCTLIAGKSFLGKLSGDDNKLLPAIAGVLTEIEPTFHDHIIFSENKKIEGYDAVIATGSNNSARYFEYYFSHVPSIIRRNRNGIAVLTGNESPEELAGLGEDICRYFGLGCRSVSKVFVPEGYDPALLLKACEPFKEQLFSHHKYMNNYTYQKTILMMNQIACYDNDVLLVAENTGYSSPVGVVYYEHYHETEKLLEKLTLENDLIQCIVSSMKIPGATAPGRAQKPALQDFADGVNTLEFLFRL